MRCEVQEVRGATIMTSVGLNSELQGNPPSSWSWSATSTPRAGDIVPCGDMAELGSESNAGLLHSQAGQPGGHRSAGPTC